MTKQDTLISPAGRAIFPKLTEPDTKFKEEGEYSVKLLLTEAEAAVIREKCEAVRQQAFDEQFEKIRSEKPKMSAEKIRESIKLAELPIKPYEDPDTGEETGEYQVNFKMRASGVSKKTGKHWTRRPLIFDAQNNPIKPDGLEIWSGSVLKVAYELAPFCTAALGAGVSIRLIGVQIIELVSGSARDAASLGFEKEESGYTHTTPGSGSPFDGGSGADDDGDGGDSEEDF